MHVYSQDNHSQHAGEGRDTLMASCGGQVQAGDNEYSKIKATYGGTAYNSYSLKAESVGSGS